MFAPKKIIFLNLRAKGSYQDGPYIANNSVQAIKCVRKSSTLAIWSAEVWANAAADALCTGVAEPVLWKKVCDEEECII